MYDLLKTLCDAYGPCGAETQIRAVIRAAVESLVDDIRVDTLGNLITIRHPRGTAWPDPSPSPSPDKGGGAETSSASSPPSLVGKGAGGLGSNGPLRILLAAHMDEIAMMVTSIDANGFIRATSVGFVNPNTLLGSRIVFANGVEGTFGVDAAPIPRDAVTLPNIFIDVGATSRANCPVQVGDLGVFRHSVGQAHGSTRVFGHNLDDRAGVAVLIQLLRELGDSPHTIQAVFTVQEEFNLQGAATAAYGLEPDLAIAIDVAVAGDTPKIKPEGIRLGDGPAITVKDAAVIGNPRANQALIQAAQRAAIPHQVHVSTTGTTDAMAIQVSRSGVPVATLSLPSRYIHTPTQMVDLGDLRGAVDLLKALLSSATLYQE